MFLWREVRSLDLKHLRLPSCRIFRVKLRTVLPQARKIRPNHHRLCCTKARNNSAPTRKQKGLPLIMDTVDYVG